jgi:hypothetical protein
MTCAAEIWWYEERKIQIEEENGGENITKTRVSYLSYPKRNNTEYKLKLIKKKPLPPSTFCSNDVNKNTNTNLTLIIYCN